MSSCAISFVVVPEARHLAIVSNMSTGRHPLHLFVLQFQTKATMLPCLADSPIDAAYLWLLVCSCKVRIIRFARLSILSESLQCTVTDWRSISTSSFACSSIARSLVPVYPCSTQRLSARRFPGVATKPLARSLRCCRGGCIQLSVADVVVYIQQPYSVSSSCCIAYASLTV